jgi:transposase
LATMPQTLGGVTVGVDTHGQIHVGAVADPLGRILGTIEVTTDERGFRQLENYAKGFGTIERFGVEGTGAYGATLCRWLTNRGHEVLEVDRPDRKMRRLRGKSDPIDACAAAQAVLSGRASGVPKARDGAVEAIRVLRMARGSAVRGRTQAMNQMHALVTSAVDPLGTQLRSCSPAKLVDRCVGMRPGKLDSPAAATKFALRELARRHRALDEEVERFDEELSRLVAKRAPRLVALVGVGTDVAGALLVTAGDNPDRLRSEASFAHLCGVSPIPASSGRIHRHRLNRGGDRSANQALWRIVMVRMSWDERTRAYAARRTSEGLSKREIIRCLKRYVAREVYEVLVA